MSRSSSATATAAGRRVTPIVTLGEGSTPLAPAPRLSERLGVEVWLKCEGANPTGSFKDRGMSGRRRRAPSSRRARGVVCASTGNTAASAAAYAARAGLPAVIVLAGGRGRARSSAQARAVGGRVVEVRGSFDEALAAARELGGARHGIAARQLDQPATGIEGPEDGGVRDRRAARRRCPTCSRCPYGGGGNTTAYARGFVEAVGALPRFLRSRPASAPTTLASAIRIAEPVHRAEVGAAIERVRRRGRDRQRRGDPRRVARGSRR